MKPLQTIIEDVFRLAVFSILVIFWLPLQAASNEAIEADIKKLERAISAAQEEIAELADSKSSLRSEVETNEKSIRTMRKAVGELESKLAAATSTLTELQKSEGNLEQARTQQLTNLSSYIRNAWVQGQQATFKLLLNQEDPAEAARLLRYYQYLGNARATRIRSYATTLQKLQDTRQEIATISEQLAAGQQELQLQQRNLNDRQQIRERQLIELDSELNAGKGKLAHLEKERTATQVLLQELSNTSLPQAQGPTFASAKGKLQWPVDGIITRRYNSPYDLGDLKYEGVILAAPAGKPVHAIHAGRVIFADWFGNSGQLLIIDHGDGYMSLYAHNQELQKTVGAWVEAGEAIASVGNTGGQLASGLYFEIRHNGVTEDPSRWCKK
jgi:murein hydrolase activator